MLLISAEASQWRAAPATEGGDEIRDGCCRSESDAGKQGGKAAAVDGDDGGHGGGKALWQCLHSATIAKGYISR